MPQSKDSSRDGTNAGRLDGLRLGAVRWRVHLDYGLTTHPVHGQVVTGMPAPGISGATRDQARTRQVVPGPRLIESILELRHATDEQVVEWMKVHGHLGLHRENDWLQMGLPAERLDDVRYAVSQLALGERMLAALSAEEHRPRELHLLGLVARGGRALRGEHLDQIGIPEGEMAPPRRTLAPDLDAHDALVRLVAFWVEDLTKPWGRLRATRYTLRMEPVLLPLTPLGAAFADLYRRVAELEIGRLARTRRLLGGKRLCLQCGRSFSPRRRDQKWCSQRCQWRGLKARQRKEAKNV
jgi:hypothetical protein